LFQVDSDRSLQDTQPHFQATRQIFLFSYYPSSSSSSIMRSSLRCLGASLRGE
jgi:hypothetical protein